MNHTEKSLFQFTSADLPEDTFQVVRFSATEALSRTYWFELDLVSGQSALDLEAVMDAAAVFSWIGSEGRLPFHGILSELEQVGQAGGNTFYRAVLVPRLWWLSVTRHNQVFLAKSVPEVLEACLRDGGLSPADFELRLQRDYPVWDYLCQYGESHLDFLCRWMEREGIYFFFEQSESGEKVVITDTGLAHSVMTQGRNIRYAPPSGLEYIHREGAVHAFSLALEPVPGSLHLRDVHYEIPSLEIAAKAAVSSGGTGDVYLYGGHFRSPEEAERLAVIWAEEARCREKRFHGSGTVPFLRPGYRFSLADHFRKDVNGEYLTVAVEHEGSQAAYLLSGLGLTLSQGERQPFYRNRFTAIPGSVQYRPERKTARPRCHGVLSARVDGSGSGQYAELDDQGRYKVVLPFDLSGRGSGKASAWIRMAQPYAGESCGMHFPLHKGTEVLLSFTDGDPDRPVIVAAVPNPAAPSPVTAENQSQSVVQTASGNRLAIEDRQGSERILLSTPATQTFLRMGHPNDPPSWLPDALIPLYSGFENADWSKIAPNTYEKGKAGWTFSTPGWLSIFAGASNSVTMIESASLTGINDNKIDLGLRIDMTLLERLNTSLLAQHDYVAGQKSEYGPGWTEMSGFHTKVVADQKKAVALQESIIAERTHAIAQSNALIGDKNEIDGNTERVIGQRRDAVAEMNQTFAEEGRVEGSKEEAVAQKDRICGVASGMGAQVIEAVAEKDETVVACQRIGATVSELIGEKEQIQAIKNKIVGGEAVF